MLLHNTKVRKIPSPSKVNFQFFQKSAELQFRMCVSSKEAHCYASTHWLEISIFCRFNFDNLILMHVKSSHLLYTTIWLIYLIGILTTLIFDSVSYIMSYNNVQQHIDTNMLLLDLCSICSKQIANVAWDFSHWFNQTFKSKLIYCLCFYIRVNMMMSKTFLLFITSGSLWKHSKKWIWFFEIYAQ